MAEEKYELVHRKVIDTWGQISEVREEGSEEANPEVKYLPDSRRGHVSSPEKSIVPKTIRNFAISEGFSFQNKPKYLDPSFKRDLWGFVGG